MKAHDERQQSNPMQFGMHIWLYVDEYDEPPNVQIRFGWWGILFDFVFGYLACEVRQVQKEPPVIRVPVLFWLLAPRVRCSISEAVQSDQFGCCVTGNVTMFSAGGITNGVFWRVRC